MEATLIAVMTQTIRGAVAAEAARLQMTTTEGPVTPNPVMMQNPVVLQTPMMVPAGHQELQLVGNGRSNVSLPTDAELRQKVAQALARTGRHGMLQ